MRQPQTRKLRSRKRLDYKQIHKLGLRRSSRFKHVRQEEGTGSDSSEAAQADRPSDTAQCCTETGAINVDLDSPDRSAAQTHAWTHGQPLDYPRPYPSDRRPEHSQWVDLRHDHGIE